MLDVCDEVNDCTGLLSLNAAILAAQAGEHGRGFQVVAGEIRSLAVKTARSTVEIAALINAVRTEVALAIEAMRVGRTEVDAGFGFAREAGAALEKIVESSGRLAREGDFIQDARRAVPGRDPGARDDGPARPDGPVPGPGHLASRSARPREPRGDGHLAAAAQRINLANAEKADAGSTCHRRRTGLDGIGRMATR